MNSFEINKLYSKKMAYERLLSEPKILSFNLQIEKIGKKMVYCSKCGTQNADTANNCTNCGASLQSSYGANPNEWHSTRQHYHYDHHQRRNGGIGLLIAGLIIVILGVSLLYDSFGLFITYFWPIIMVVLGIWLLIRALRWSQRHYK